MDIESEITRLQAEGMAVQTLFVGLCHGIMGLDHRNRSVVEDAFSYAERVSEAASLKMASEENGAYLTGLAEVIEQLRAGVFDPHSNPKGGV